MLMLEKGRSILHYDESRLPLLVKILQELIEKIEEPELRCKIINCLLSTKLKVSLPGDFVITNIQRESFAYGDAVT